MIGFTSINYLYIYSRQSLSRSTSNVEIAEESWSTKMVLFRPWHSLLSSMEFNSWHARYSQIRIEQANNCSDGQMHANSDILLLVCRIIILRFSPECGNVADSEQTPEATEPVVQSEVS